MSKGSKRRLGKPGAYERGYEAIDWAKGRPASVPPKPTVQDILVKDYFVKEAWTMPSLKDMMSPEASWWPTAKPKTCGECGGHAGCTNPPSEPHTCPYQVEINDNHESLCTCCPDCAHECAMDI